MKQLLYFLLIFSSSVLLAEKQDSIGVETKDNTKYVKYLVTPGETIYRLSTTHGVAITQLMTDNPGLEEGLKVGQIVLLRNFVRTEPLVRESEFDSPKTSTHVVQKGETYYGLSKKYNIPVETLLKWNGVELKEGQVLVVKDPESNAVVAETEPVVDTKPVTESKPVTTTTSPTPVKSTTTSEKVNPVAVMGSEEKPTTAPKTETKPVATEVKPVVTETKPAVSETKPVITETKPEVKTPTVAELVNDEDIYEYNPNKQQVLVVPFDPHLYWSDADDEIMKGSNLSSKLEVRKTIRRRLNALLDPMGYETIHLLGGRFRDTLTDLNKIYTSVSYDYQNAILSEEYKKTLSEQEASNKKDGEVATDNSMKNKLTGLKNKVTAEITQQKETTEEDQKLDKNADKYFGVIIKDPKFFEYFDHKYSIDYYIFINQFEVITDYDHCLDRTTQNYRRYFVVHFSIFDAKGKQIAGNKYKQFYDSNSNNIDKITGDNLQAMADRILMELPLPK